MQPDLREATVKKLFKEALVETLHEQRELLQDVLAEVLEDTALTAAIRQGRQTEKGAALLRRAFFSLFMGVCARGRSLLGAPYGGTAFAPRLIPGSQSSRPS
jgi:hypothetical protein